MTVKLTASQQKLVNAMASGPVSAPEAMEKTGFSKSAVYNHMMNLGRKKLVLSKDGKYSLLKGSSQYIKTNGHANGNGHDAPEMEYAETSDVPEIRRLQLLHSQMGDAIRALGGIVLNRQQRKVIAMLSAAGKNGG